MLLIVVPVLVMLPSAVASVPVKLSSVRNRERHAAAARDPGERRHLPGVAVVQNQLAAGRDDDGRNHRDVGVGRRDVPAGAVRLVDLDEGVGRSVAVERQVLVARAGPARHERPRPPVIALRGERGRVRRRRRELDAPGAGERASAGERAAVHLHARRDEDVLRRAEKEHHRVAGLSFRERGPERPVVRRPDRRDRARVDAVIERPPLDRLAGAVEHLDPGDGLVHVRGHHRVRERQVVVPATASQIPRCPPDVATTRFAASPLNVVASSP